MRVLKSLDFWAKRAVAYPLVALSMALSAVAEEFLVLGQFLLEE
jgi:hypothetical protein